MNRKIRWCMCSWAQNNEPVVLPSVVAASMTLPLASGFLNSWQCPEIAHKSIDMSTKTTERVHRKWAKSNWGMPVYLGRAGRRGESLRTWRRRAGWGARHRGRWSGHLRRRAGRSYRRRPPPGWPRPTGGPVDQWSPNRPYVPADTGKEKSDTWLAWRGRQETMWRRR